MIKLLIYVDYKIYVKTVDPERQQIVGRLCTIAMSKSYIEFVSLNVRQLLFISSKKF